MQVNRLHSKYDQLQLRHGDPSLSSVYGAGCVSEPELMFIFMNPTARDLSALKNWDGLRAPWIGMKGVWQLFYQLGLISEPIFKNTQKIKAKDWSKELALEIYIELKKNEVFVTSLAKCSQIDARPLRNEVFKDYLDLMRQEILSVKPKHILTFGNQVSGIVLDKSVSISAYEGDECELITIEGNDFKVYPVHYPVGRGKRNMPIAINRIKKILSL